MISEQEIVDKIVYEIHTCKYGTNEKLPSENEMADSLGVPRITVRKAYKRLQEMDYIYARQGIGSFVKDRFKQIKLVLSGDVSFSKKMKDMGVNLVTKNIFCTEIDYNKNIYEFLGVEKGVRVFKIGRLRFIDQKPMALHISYVADSVFYNIAEDGKSITSMFEYYRSQGYGRFDSTTSTLSVQFPSPYERRILKCPNLIPLLVLESGCIDRETGRVLEQSRIVYRSDCFTYLV